MTFDKEFLLKKSKTFCMAPWIHLHSSPVGQISPCCIARNNTFPLYKTEGIRNTKNSSMIELVNSPIMNNLRHQMLNEKESPMCNACYDHEIAGVDSLRTSMNIEFGHHFDESVNETNDDGSLKSFTMRYFDIRFNNICNFKCRTCGPAFSSLWEQENKRYNISIQKYSYTQLLQDVLDQIPNIETAYFAGGEPLITEEHYLILEEMIRQGRTDITLRYNTNLSNLKFKNKEIFELWRQFKKRVSVYASIDHFGERAEYIRHGTNWGDIESNFIAVKKETNINLQMNTVLSLFNYLTLKEFYQYLYDKKLYVPKDFTFSLYNMSTPEHLSVSALPMELRLIGRKKLEELIIISKNYHKFSSSHKISQFENAIKWDTNSPDNWDSQKSYLRSEIARIDSIRDENFIKVFPELAKILEEE